MRVFLIVERDVGITAGVVDPMRFVFLICHVPEITEPIIGSVMIPVVDVQRHHAVVHQPDDSMDDVDLSLVLDLAVTT
jgi:hypothetical protein